jgi:general secretion pathway protein G
MRTKGFTLLDMLIALAILALVSSIAVPSYVAYVEQANVHQAVADLGVLDMRLERYFSNNFDYPDSLDELGGAPPPLDPWGNPYRYLKIRNNDEPGLVGRLRKDRNLVPINSDFDLYSEGADSDTQPPLNASPSRDDVVRGADGSFVGLAPDF